MWYSYLIPPVVGAVIGYFTNDIAIRMLFRPHRRKAFLGINIPFTPGLIPKEKARIASSVADAVSINLMNKETLEKYLLSEEMLSKIKDGVQSFFDYQRQNHVSLKTHIEKYIACDDVEAISSRVCDGISKLISEKLTDKNVDRQIAKAIVAYLMEKLDHGLWGVVGADKLVGTVSDSIERKLSDNLNRIMRENASDLATSIVTNQKEALFCTSMSELTEVGDEKIEQIKSWIADGYESIIRQHLPRIVEVVDIKTIVEGRINEMEVGEMEQLILQVMRKELRAIVWLGALLGGIIGLLNLLVIS